MTSSGPRRWGKLRPLLSPTLPISPQTLGAPQPTPRADETMALVQEGGQVSFPRPPRGGSLRLRGVWEQRGPQRLGRSPEGGTHCIPSF